MRISDWSSDVCSSDLSVIDELPPGRTPIQTVVLSNEKRDEVLARIAEACRQQRQTYWVCTLIEESDELDAEAAEATATKLRAELPGVRVGLVHGRMKSDAKDEQMRAFQADRKSTRRKSSHNID